MVIGIDGHDLEGKRTGVGRYLFNILESWKRSGAIGNDRVIVYFKDAPPPDIASPFEPHLLPPLFGKQSHALFMHWLLPRAATRDGIDVLWCPGYVAPLVLARRRRGTANGSRTGKRQGRAETIPLVLTLHDIIYEARPELFNWKSPADKVLLAYVSKKAAGKARRILVPSRFTASEVVRLYGIPENRIVITPEAASDEFRPDAVTPYGAGRYGVRGSYLLFVGSIFTRRHVPECIEAFARLAPDFPTYQFFIVGGNQTRPHVALEELIMRFNETIGRQAIVWVPYVSPDDLPELYRGAEALVWLSDYEGFGLPPLEALACGTPVITTQAAALPETVGDCAVFIEHPSDINAIADAMRSLLMNASVQQRLSSCGPARAAQFSWDRCAEQTLAALRDAAQSE